MSVKLKVIIDSGQDFEQAVEKFINSVEVVRTNYTSHNMLIAFIEYEEKPNGTKPRKPKVSPGSNTRDKKLGK